MQLLDSLTACKRMNPVFLALRIAESSDHQTLSFFHGLCAALGVGIKIWRVLEFREGEDPVFLGS